MIIQHILYSRSFGEDFRWIKRPNLLAENELEVLRNIRNSYAHHLRDIFQFYPVSPLYLLDFNKCSVLATCAVVKAKDKMGRHYTALEGIAVAHEYRRQFWFCVPQMLTVQQHLLSAWRTLHPDTADPYRDLLDEEDIDIKSFDRPLKYPIVQTRLHEVPFGEDGRRVFVNAISDPFLPFSTFIFGATPDVIQQIRDVKFIVPVLAPTTSSIPSQFPPTPEALPEMLTQPGETVVSKPNEILTPSVTIEQHTLPHPDLTPISVEPVNSRKMPSRDELPHLLEKYGSTTDNIAETDPNQHRKADRSFFGRLFGKK